MSNFAMQHLREQFRLADHADRQRALAAVRHTTALEQDQAAQVTRSQAPSDAVAS
jgi:hypothetical protein